MLHKIRNTTICMPIYDNKTYNDIWSRMWAVRKEDGTMLNNNNIIIIIYFL